MDRLTTDQLPTALKQFVSDKKTASDIKTDLAKPPTGRSLVTKLAEVMATVDRVAKNGHNDHFNYDFATESDVALAIRAEMASRHLMLVPDVQSLTFREVNGRNGIQTIATLMVRFSVHDGESGESLAFCVPGEGQDQGDKAVPKAMTSAEKYALLKLFMVPTGDDVERTDTRQKRAQEPKDAPRRGNAHQAEPYARTGVTTQANGESQRVAVTAGRDPQPMPANVNQQTGEEYPRCPDGAWLVLKYELDRYGWHRGLICNNRVDADHAIDIKTKMEFGVLLKAAAESHKPVTLAYNDKGYVTKLDWFIGPIAKKLRAALTEDQPPFDDGDAPQF